MPPIEMSCTGSRSAVIPSATMRTPATIVIRSWRRVPAMRSSYTAKRHRGDADETIPGRIGAALGVVDERPPADRPQGQGRPDGGEAADAVPVAVGGDGAEELVGAAGGGGGEGGAIVLLDSIAGRLPSHRLPVAEVRPDVGEVGPGDDQHRAAGDGPGQRVDERRPPGDGPGGDGAAELAVERSAQDRQHRGRPVAVAVAQPHRLELD